MSGFLRPHLPRLRKEARLDPMPAFLCNYGRPLVGDEWAEYIDSRYFSPAALYWADNVVSFMAEGLRLSAADEECFERVWSAIRAGRRPSDGQVKKFKEDRMWRRAESRIPGLFASEMQRRGVQGYGPDSYIGCAVPVPKSGPELMYKALAKDFGYPNAKAMKAAHNRWKNRKKKEAKLADSTK